MAQHHERVIELLIQHGAVPVLRDDANFVLYRGVWTHVPVAKLLIQLARQSTVPGSVSVANLLQYAIRDPDGCNPEIIHYFIDHEADPTALFRSIRDGHGLGYCNDPETVRCLLEYGAGSAALPGEALRGALDIAIMHRRLNVARTLLECDDITPALHEWIAAIDMFDMAVVTGSERLVYEILQSGASVEGWSENEAICESPLMRAVKNRQENMVRLLLRHGAKPHSQALIEAIRLGSVPMARMLLDAGADPNCKDKFHLCGLALLVAVGHEDLFRLLIERGAAMPSGDDLTSMLKEILSKSGVPELQMMLDRGVSLANQRFSLLQFAMRGTLEMLDFLYNNGFLKETTYPDARDTRHIWTLMADPLFILHPHLLGWLLDKDLVDMPCCAADPYSILVGLFQPNADDQQKEKTLDVLVRHGIDINVTTQQNSRPVVWNKVILHSKVALKAFLDRGAKMLPEHADGHKTFLSCSRSAEHLEMMLSAVLRDSSRAQARRLLLDMKEYAGEKKKWPTVRCLERFQYQNGLYRWFSSHGAGVLFSGGKG